MKRSFAYAKYLPTIIVAGGVSLALAIGISLISHPHTALAACSPSGTTYGTDTMSVTVPAADTYNIWVRMEVPSTTSDEIMLQMDGGDCYVMGGSSSIPANTWTWVDYQNGNTSSIAQQSLAEGTHSIELIGTEAGVGIDRVELLSDQTCVPTGTGDNCTPPVDTPPTVALTAPSSGATVTGTSVALSATASDDQSVTQVQFQVDGTTIGTDTTSPYTATWNSTTVSDGTHTITATATDSAGLTSTATETVTVANHTCSGAPSVPSGLAGTSPSSTQINLTWNASTATSGCSINNYTVYRGSTAIGNPTATSLSVTGLTPSTQYTFTITATDNDGHTSAASSAVVVTTAVDTTPPSTPTNVVATAPSSSEVSLSWNASTDSVVSISSYKIMRNGSLLATVTAPTTTYNDTSVSANTAYSYQVIAVDSVNNVSAAADAQPYPITTPKAVNTTPPSAPANLSSPLSTSSTVDLTWSASTASSGNTITGYRIYRNSTLVTTVTTTSYVDTGLSPSTTYKYYVEAVDSSSNVSAASSTLSVTTEAGTPTLTYCLDGNASVDFDDGLILFNHWGLSPDPLYNYDGSNVVDFGDAVDLFNHWGQTC